MSLFKRKLTQQEIAQKEFDQGIHNIEIESNINILSDNIKSLQNITNTDHYTKRILETINNLCKLNLDGDHKCYVEDKAVVLSFKKGCLVSITDNL